MTQCCSCCAGGLHEGPASLLNRPGLGKLDFRLGAHASFRKAMLARLSSTTYPQLGGLRTREATDFSIAFLDACAVVGDVLCFYQERIANEGYFGTATERRSLLELARLIGYVPRPGVSASAYLAYTLDRGAVKAEIPKGSKANTIPGPGEDVQAFETSETLIAREEWNAIRPRQTMPQSIDSILGKGDGDGLYLKGTATRLKPGDRLLIKVNDKDVRVAAVTSLEAFEAEQYTWVKLNVICPTAAVLDRTADNAKDDAHTPAGANDGVPEAGQDTLKLGIFSLNKAAAVPPAGPLELPRNTAGTFAAGQDVFPRLLTHYQPEYASTLYQAWNNAAPVNPVKIEVFALRIAAHPFGHNAPLRMVALTPRGDGDGPGMARPLTKVEEWLVDHPWGGGEPEEPKESRPPQHGPNTLYLDNDYDLASGSKGATKIDGESIIVLESEISVDSDDKKAAKIETKISVVNPSYVSKTSIAAYGLTGKTVKIDWEESGSWLEPEKTAEEEVIKFAPVRQVRVFAGGEKLELAKRPVGSAVCGGEFELDRLYEGLEAGRWLIVSGERTDVLAKVGDKQVPVPGIWASELVMLSSVEHIRKSSGGEQPEPAAGETYHTKITLATGSTNGAGLAYCYKRDTVTINANVVKATHGETRTEILGSGNAAEPFQAFELKQSPLTHVSAATPSGIQSTLEVLVNGVAWRERASLAAEDGRARTFVTRTDDDNRTSIIFGDGKHGQRLPTARENIRASYRSGIGRQGNVRAKQIALLATRPLGVKEVINPIRASGGADRENIAGIRRNAPASVGAFDRLVSVADYEDFACVFGGVSKASAELINTKARGSILHVTIAGDGDDLVEAGSDLFRNLRQALVQYGDDDVRIKLAARQRLALIISAGVKLLADFRWEFVEPQVRATLLERFGFERMDLGGTLFLSEAIAAIQGIEGVDYVDVDVFDTLDSEQVAEGVTSGGTDLGLKAKICARGAHYSEDGRSIVAAGLVYLSPDIPDTLLLQEIKA